MNFIKIKRLLFITEYYQESKNSNLQNEKKIVSHISGKVLIFRIYIYAPKTQQQKTTQKMGTNLNKHLSKEDTNGQSTHGKISFFFKYILSIMLLQLSHFPPFIPLCPAYPLPPTFPPPLVHVHGHTWKDFNITSR